MKNIFWLVLLSALYGCERTNTDKHYRLSDDVADSIKQAKINTFLAKEYNAVDFNKYYYKKFTVDFDTVLNTNVLLNDYTVKDINRSSNDYTVKVSLHKKFLFTLIVSTADTDLIKKIDTGGKPTLVFDLIGLNKVDTASHSLFLCNGIIINK